MYMITTKEFCCAILKVSFKRNVEQNKYRDPKLVTSSPYSFNKLISDVSIFRFSRYHHEKRILLCNPNLKPASFLSFRSNNIATIRAKKRIALSGIFRAVRTIRRKEGKLIYLSGE